MSTVLEVVSHVPEGALSHPIRAFGRHSPSFPVILLTPQYHLLPSPSFVHISIPLSFLHNTHYPLTQHICIDVGWGQLEVEFVRHHATRQLEGLVEVGADERLLLGGADGGDHLAVDGVLVGLALLSQLVLLWRETRGGGQWEMRSTRLREARRTPGED